MSNSGDRTTVERITIDVSDEALPLLREVAETHGLSVEEEVRSLVERTYTRRAEDDWVTELIAIAGGVGMDLPERHDLPEDRETFGAD